MANAKTVLLTFAFMHWSKVYGMDVEWRRWSFGLMAACGGGSVPCKHGSSRVCCYRLLQVRERERPIGTWWCLTVRTTTSDCTSTAAPTILVGWQNVVRKKNGHSSSMRGVLLLPSRHAIAATSKLCARHTSHAYNQLMYTKRKRRSFLKQKKERTTERRIDVIYHASQSVCFFKLCVLFCVRRCFSLTV